MRLIDAHDIWTEIMLLPHNGDMISSEEVEKAIVEAPTVDAVEVVRCKECEHRRDDEDFASGHYCVKRPSNGGYFCEDNDFCSYGERRNNDA